MSKRVLAYSIYYYPEVASTAQLYAELFEALSDEFEFTVVCAVPCYTGTVPLEYREDKLYIEDHGGVIIVRVPVRAYDKGSKKERVLNILDFWRGARKATHALLTAVERYDLVFTYSQPPILGGMLGAYGSKITGAPFICGIQDFNPEQTMAVGYAGNAAIHAAMMALDKRSCELSSCVVVPGRDLGETLERRFAGKDVPRYEVINNWIDVRHRARARVRQPLRRGRHTGHRRQVQPEGGLRRRARIRGRAARPRHGRVAERRIVRRRVDVQLPRHQGVQHHRGRGGVLQGQLPARRSQPVEELRHHRARGRGVRRRQRQDERVLRGDGDMQPTPSR